MSLLGLLTDKFIPDIAKIICGYFPDEKSYVGDLIKFGSPCDYFSGKFKMSEVLYCGCQCGNEQLVSRIVDEKFDVRWVGGLQGACVGGDLKMVKLMLKMDCVRGVSAIGEACLGGNIEIVKLLLDRDDYIYNQINHHMLNWALYNACKCGDMEIINLLIANGVDDWTSGLEGSCVSNKPLPAKLMIEKGARITAYTRECANAELTSILNAEGR